MLQDASSVVVYHDTDGDPSTGLSVHGLGAEIRWGAGLRSGASYTAVPDGLTDRTIRRPSIEGGPSLRKSWKSSNLATLEQLPGCWFSDGSALSLEARGRAVFFRVTLDAE